MVLSSPKKSITLRERSNEIRGHAPERPGGQMQQQDTRILMPTPAAGAHAALHLTNEDATPGAGVLPSHMHQSGKEVDGAAG